MMTSIPKLVVAPKNHLLVVSRGPKQHVITKAEFINVHDSSIYHYFLDTSKSEHVFGTNFCNVYQRFKITVKAKDYEKLAFMMYGSKPAFDSGKLEQKYRQSFLSVGPIFQWSNRFSDPSEAAYLRSLGKLTPKDFPKSLKEYVSYGGDELFRLEFLETK